MTTKLYSQILLLIILLVTACSSGSAKKQKNIQKEKNKTEMDNFPPIIEAYNNTVIDAYSLRLKDEWNEWIVEDDISTDGYVSYDEYIKECSFKIVYSKQQDFLQIENLASGEGEETFGLYKLLDNTEKTIYFFLHKTSAPEWLDTEKKLVIVNKETGKTETTENISDPAVEIELFFKPGLSLNSLKENQVVSININYNPANNSFDAVPFKSYLFNCSGNNNINNINEKEWDEICALISKMKPQKHTFHWNNEKQLFTSTNKSSRNEDLIGKWHSEPMVSDALSTTYAFFSNSEYIFSMPEGITNKKLYTKGTYSIENEIITLEPKTEGFLDGAIVKYDEAIEDSILSGGTILEKEIRKEKIKYSISKVEFSEEYNNFIVKIDDMEWFRISDDPND